MKKTTASFMLKTIPALLIILGGQVNGQNKYISGDSLENLVGRFTDALLKVQKLEGASNADYKVFTNFYMKQINSDEGKLYSDVENRKINSSNIDVYEKSLIKEYTGLYKKFQVIKREYPSSVKEYSHYYPNLETYTCDSACSNPNFANGTLDGWYAYYGVNSSEFTSYFNITGITGGACGPVTRAAQDPNTSNTYQVAIMNGGNDPIIPAIPRVSPYSSSNYSARIGDSTGTNYGVAELQQTFKVTSTSTNFTYQYAIFLQNPANHTYYQQPFFSAVVLDSVGDTIPVCGKYFVLSGFWVNGNNAGWDSIVYNGEKLFYRNWTSVFVSLKNYIGHCVTVRFTAADCALGGHFGYAYVTTSCSPTQLISSSPAFCGQTTINLTAPPGGTSYKWTGPINGIVGSDSNQVVTIDSSGTYTVVVEPVTGAICNDTLTINVPTAPGPPPVPSFTADTACSGQQMQFTNTSVPLTGPGVKFYWDFYNTGFIEDSTTNPLWTYNVPGNYTVKLHEVNNGCGADTVINVHVDSTVAGAFTSTPACVNQSVTFINNSSGASSYKWNFGDPSSGAADSSVLVNPSHTFDTAGTYMITLIAKNAGPCPDTVRQSITVLPLPVPLVTGPDSVCIGSSITLNANALGATSYSWTPTISVSCPTCSSTSVDPTVTTTYTVTANNGTCSGDSTFTVNVKPLPVATITANPDTICPGDSTMLIAGGGGTYVWTNTGQTSGSIWVKPATTNTYNLQVTKDGCIGITSQQVFVRTVGTASISVVKDTICPYDSTTMTAAGGTSYHWLSPLSSNNATVTVKSNTTATFSVVVTNSCFTDTLSKTLHIAPVPKVAFSGNTLICRGQVASITASGGSSYSWSNGNIGSTLNVNPTSTTTYTVTVSNGTCSSDSTITVVVDTPNITISPNEHICAGNSITLSASGGNTYQWSNGATTSTISVSPNSDTSYSVKVINGCVDSGTITVTVDNLSLYACCQDTIIRGDTAHIHASGQTDFTWSPTGSLDCPTCPDPVASPTVTTTYTVSYTDSNGCTVSRTVTVVVEVPCADFNVPNVFTPNNDGINDDFVVTVLNASSYSIIIYDRWGKKVYSSNDITQYWNGKYNGKDYLVPDGVYYYIIKATCGNNNYVKKGFVHVLGEK